MILASQMYSKLFRPWDVVGVNKSEREVKTEEDNYMKKSAENKLDIPEDNVKKNRHDKGQLRKIRNQYKKEFIYNALHQDSTISTTTDEDKATLSVSKESSVVCDEKYLQKINERLGHQIEIIDKKQSGCNKVSKPASPNNRLKKDDANLLNGTIPHSSIQYNNYYQDGVINQLELLQYSDPFSQLGRHPSEVMSQAEIAQSLGIPPTDPLLMESFAQGYAMELEYARILHQENQAKLLNARKQRPKKYRCPHCDVGFSNNGQLKGHVRIHTGERPFKCDDKNCGKTFTRNEELTRHRRIHSGLRPYPCQTCGKKFGRRDHLKKHTKTHLVQVERMMPMFVPLSAIPSVPGYPYLYGY